MENDHRPSICWLPHVHRNPILQSLAKTGGVQCPAARKDGLHSKYPVFIHYCWLFSIISRVSQSFCWSYLKGLLLLDSMRGQMNPINPVVSLAISAQGTFVHFGRMKGIFLRDMNMIQTNINQNREISHQSLELRNTCRIIPINPPQRTFLAKGKKDISL